MTDDKDKPISGKLDIRPRCIACGERWMPSEGVAAQAEPCDECSPITMVKARRWAKARKALLQRVEALEQAMYGLTQYLCISCGWHGEKRWASCPMCGQVGELREFDNGKVAYRDGDPQLKAEKLTCSPDRDQPAPSIPLELGVTAANARIVGHKIRFSIPDEAVCVGIDPKRWSWPGGGACEAPNYTTFAQLDEAFGSPGVPDDPDGVAAAAKEYLRRQAQTLQGGGVKDDEPVQRPGDSETLCLFTSNVVAWVDAQTQEVCIHLFGKQMVRISKEDVPVLAGFLFDHVLGIGKQTPGGGGGQ